MDESAGLGLLWIPIVIGLQLAFLYAALGGPVAVLQAYVDVPAAGRGSYWNRLYVGVPLALLLSFPALFVLALTAKLIREVGLAELATVQLGTWLLMLNWQRRRQPCASVAPPPGAGELPDSSSASGLATAVVEAVFSETEARPMAQKHFSLTALPVNASREETEGAVEPCGTASITVAALSAEPCSSPLAAAPSAGKEQAFVFTESRAPSPIRAPSSTVPTKKEPAIQPLAGYGAKISEHEAGLGERLGLQLPSGNGVVLADDFEKPKAVLLKKLEQIYFWGDIGLQAPFSRSRQLGLDELISSADLVAYGSRHIEDLRAVARGTIDLFLREKKDTTAPEGDFLGGDYVCDVVRRLTCSALFSRERLFIDQTDLEIFGTSLLDFMYRLVLYETSLARQSPKDVVYH